MYESKQPHMRERTNFVKRNPDGENRTGIPPAMRNRYEEASGLSFADVRIHYNSPKPEQLQALAYTQGNHVYVAPGQERHLGHELGHVIQQKRGLVKPTFWMGGLPVNDDPKLERQAEQGSNTPQLAAGYFTPAERPVAGNGQDIVQGVFMKWVGEDGEEQTLVETGARESQIDSGNLSMVGILSFLRHVRNADLSQKLNREIYGRLCGIEEDGERMEVLQGIRSLNDEGTLTMDALDYDCCNELWRIAKRMEWICRKESGYSEEDADNACNVRKLVEAKLSKAGEEEADAFDKVRYSDLWKEIDELEELLNKANKETEPVKKNQFRQLIEPAIIGYLRMRKRFEKDIILRKMPLRHLQKHFRRVFGEGVRKSEGGVSLTDINIPNRLPATYAEEKSQQVPLPAKGDLSNALTDRDPLVRTEDAVTKELAKNILEKLQQSGSRERLVIYRGMGAQEAISILGFFDSHKAAETEKAVMAGVAVNTAAGRHVAPLGKHFGERAQAEGYNRFRVVDGDYANVLLAFVLKPGAKELLFSKSLLVLPVPQREDPGGFWIRLRGNHGGYGTVSASEGAKAGYIGIKPESGAGVLPTYSLGIANQSRFLLQLLVDRVEVKRILT